MFGERFLQPADRMFPHVTAALESVPMLQTIYNQRLKKIWQSFAREAKDVTVPPGSHVCSSYFRHVWVTATYPKGDIQSLTEVASHMSHQLSTAKRHYDASVQLELTSRSTAYFNDLMFGNA